MCVRDYSDAAKDYLCAIRRERQAIDSDIEMVRGLADDAASITAAINPDRVGGSKDPHSGEDRLIKIADITGDIDARWIRHRDTCADALRIIMQLEDSRYRRILCDRYLRDRKWDTIADALQYEIRQVFRLHGEALFLFGKLLVEKRVIECQ